MKNTIIAILLFIAILLVGGAGYYAYTEMTSEVSFYVDGEEYHSARVGRYAGSVTLPDAPIKQGHVFDGWFFDEGVWQDPYTQTTFKDKKMDATVKLYARWHVHDYTIEESNRVEPTCTEEGSYDLLTACYGCGIAHTEKMTIPALGHKYEASSANTLSFTEIGGRKQFTCTLKCQNNGCDHVETLRNVKVNETKVEPTCQKKGTYTYTYVYSYTNNEDKIENITVRCKVEVPMISHKLGNTLVDKIETFTTDMEGVYIAASSGTPACGEVCNAYFTCSGCDQMISVQAIKSHNGIWNEITPPTCTTVGKEETDCADCKQTVQRDIAKTAHTYEWTWTADEAFGIFTLTGECSSDVCDETVLLENMALQGKVQSKSTCIKAGTMVYSFTCEDVEYTIERALPLLEHRINGKNVSLCRDEAGRISIELDNVNYFENYVDGDDIVCGETYPGYFVCSDCGVSWSTDVYRPHKWSAWETVTEAKCEQAGEEKKTCEYCGDVITQPIDALSHIDAYTLKYDTARDAFDLIGTCTLCDRVVTTETDVAAVEGAVVQKPTCTTMGKTEYVYTYENKEYFCTVDTVAMTEHLFGGKTYDELVDANGLVNCTKNPTVITRVFDEDPLAECMKNYAGAVFCDTCEFGRSATLFVEHDMEVYLKTEPVNNDPATVELFGVCRKCEATAIYTGFEKVEVAEIEGIDPPTCVGEGRLQYTCTKDGEEFVTVVIVGIDEDAHQLNGKSYTEYQNSDGSFNSTVKGIYIIADTSDEGGYICTLCNRFVEVTVRRR